MESIHYFFRSTSDQSDFTVFGKTHLLILFIAFLVSIFIFIRKIKNRNLEIFIGSVLILQQVTLYTWYFTSNFNLLQQGLPLYHCRVAIIFLGFGLVLNKEFMVKLGCSWGIVGSILALLLPSVDPFLFPHITQFSFFIGHLFLLWGSIHILFIKKIVITKRDFENIIAFTNIYHILMYIVNTIVGSNYGYMNASPIGIGNNLHPLLYGLIVIILFNIILNIEYRLINKTDVKDENYQIQAQAT